MASSTVSTTAATDDPFAYSNIIKGYFKEDLVKPVQKLLCLLVVMEISQQNIRRPRQLYASSATSFARYATSFVTRSGMFSGKGFDKFFSDYLEKRFIERRVRFANFSEGGLLAATEPKPGVITRIKDGKSVWDDGKYIESRMHEFTWLWKLLLVNDMPPSGKNYDDVLEAVRRLIHMNEEKKKDEHRKKRLKENQRGDSEGTGSLSENLMDDSNSSSADESLYMDNVDINEIQNAGELFDFSEYIPENYWPEGWLAFVLYGPYGQIMYDSEQLLLLTDDAKLQNLQAVSRSLRRQNQRQSKRNATRTLNVASNMEDGLEYLN